MSWRRILVLLVLVAALGAYLVAYEIPKAEREAKKEKLVAFDRDAVTGVVLTYPDREIALEKKDGAWRLARPVEAAADEDTVKSLLGTLADAEVVKSLDEVAADSATFGLDAPSPKVSLTLEAGTPPPAIAVGKNTTIGSKTYVRKGDEPKVYLTTASLKAALDKKVKDLRDKRLFRFEDDQVKRVEITREDGITTTLVRQDENSWTVDPGDHPADPTEARSLLSSLRTARATDFPDDAPSDLGKYGLDTPRLAITVTLDKDATETLLLGSERTEGSQKELYAKLEHAPVVYALGDWTLRTLDKSAADLRDKTVLDFDPARVGEVALERKDGGTLTLARVADAWQVQGADGGEPKGDAIDRFLEDLRDLRGSGIAAEPAAGKLADYGLDAPDLRIALTDKDGEVMGTIVAAKSGGNHYVMRAGADTIFEARDYMYTRLDKQQSDFVEPKADAAEPKAGANGAGAADAQ